MLKINFLRKIIFVVVVLVLVSCKQQPLTRLYLFQHPDVLQEQLIKCETEKNRDCELPKSVDEEYRVLNSQRQENPELFGKIILHAQQEFAKIRSELNIVNSELVAHPQDIELAKKKKVLIEREIAQLDRINTLLAVVASTSPE